MKVAFYTLGCKVNQNETGALAQLFYENGFEPAPDGGEADVYIVNSCTVTAGGDKKSRQWLRRAKRRNPGAVTVLTGCFPQACPGEALAVEEADIITGSGARRRVLDNVLRFLQQLNKEGSTVILITHDNGIAATARRIVRLTDGRIVEDHAQEVDWL